MKKIDELKRFLLLAVLAVAGLFATSCSKNDDESDDPKVSAEVLDDLVKNTVFEVVSDETINASQMVDLAFGHSGSSSDERMELARTFLLKKHQDIASKLGANNADMGWRSVSYTYLSTDEQGKEIKLSARVLWGNIGGTDLDPDYIMLCPHYTITKNAECPTQSYPYETAVLCGDNLLILPDYLGFGESKDHPQPYVNHNLCAQNCIDALEAGYKVFRENSTAHLEDGYKLFVAGLSQGGGNSLAIHKWLDTHPDIADAWQFAYSYSCAGPYSPSLTFRKYYKQERLFHPCVLPITLKAMFAAYPDILGKWTEDDFYNADYLTNHKAEMDQILADKNLTTDSINAKLFNWYPHDTECIYLSDIMSADALNSESDMCQALLKCLDDNDLTKGWTPTHKILLFHGKDDEVVPFANAEAVVAAFPDKTELMLNSFGGGHLGAGLMWMVQIMNRAW